METCGDDKKRRALASMIELGFSEETVCNVLTQLLKTYEGEWTHIESENYDVLIQTLLDPVQTNEETTVPTSLPDRNPETAAAKRSPAPPMNLKRTSETSPSAASQLCRRKSTRKSETQAGSSRSLFKQNAAEGAEGSTSSKLKLRNRDSGATGSVFSSGAAAAASASASAVDPRSLISAQLELEKKFVIRKKHDPNDISKGYESIPIPIINRHNDETIPEDFTYISTSLVHENAAVNISLTNIGDKDCCTRCFGNCLKKKYPCPCTTDMGGEYPYTDDGCLKERFLAQAMKESRGEDCHSVKCPGLCLLLQHNQDGDLCCKGHVVRKFLKECWKKCACHTKCGNRLVQYGVKHKLEVYWTSDEKGWGLRSSENLPKGSFVCEFVGEILTNTELDARNKNRGDGQHTYPVQLNADLISESHYDDDTLLCLDATHYGNVSRFINHRCGDANLIDVPVQIEIPHRHYYHVAFFTNRAVKAYEELTWDYQLDFEDKDHPIKAFKCHCGSSSCRQPN